MDEDEFEFLKSRVEQLEVDMLELKQNYQPTLKIEKKDNNKVQTSSKRAYENLELQYKIKTNELLELKQKYQNLQERYKNECKSLQLQLQSKTKSSDKNLTQKLTELDNNNIQMLSQFKQEKKQYENTIKANKQEISELKTKVRNFDSISSTNKKTIELLTDKVRSLEQEKNSTVISYTNKVNELNKKVNSLLRERDNILNLNTSTDRGLDTSFASETAKLTDKVDSLEEIRLKQKVALDEKNYTINVLKSENTELGRYIKKLENELQEYES